MRHDREVWTDGNHHTAIHAASIAVTEWNGTVADKLDDGFIAFFAYPVTQEDDLERAVHAARAIQRSAFCIERSNRKFAPRKGAPLIAIKGLELTGVVRHDSRQVERVLLRTCARKLSRLCWHWRIRTESSGKMSHRR